MGVTQTLLRNILVGLSALSFSTTWLRSKLQKKDAASIPNAVGKGKSYPSNNKKFAYPAFSSYFGQQLYQNHLWNSESFVNARIPPIAG